MNVINNVNAKTSKVLDNLNYCKDYVNLETDAYITAAVLKYFSMESLDTPAQSFIPPNILHGSKHVKRMWLHNHMEAMLFKFVMADQQKEHDEIRNKVVEDSQPRQTPMFFCDVCGKQYRYLKAKDNHVKKQYPDHEEQFQPVDDQSSKKDAPKLSRPEDKDDFFDYAKLRLSMGLFLRNFDDSIKEGDGVRTLRCWKFALLLFRTYNHTKYALAALQLQAFVQAMLSPRLAHWLIWNRTVNNKGGIGKNIPMDLRLEHMNNLLKGLLKHLGPNLTESAANRCSKSIGHVERLLDSVDEDLEVKRPSGHHKVHKSEADFRALVSELAHKGDVFKNSPSKERGYIVFSNFKRSLLSGLDYSSLNKWITHHKKEFFKLEPVI
jgi:serine palmitoyltransferase